MAELAFCLVCGKCLGELRPYYAQEHVTTFPTHRQFLTKSIIDPFALPDLDAYLARLTARQTILDTKKYQSESGQNLETGSVTSLAD